MGRKDGLLGCKEQSLGLLEWSLGSLRQSLGSQDSFMARSHYSHCRKGGLLGRNDGLISCIFKNTIPYLGNGLLAVSLKLHLDIVSSKLCSQDGLMMVATVYKHC